MKTVFLAILAVITLIAPPLQAQEHQVSVDVDFVSRYIWRGFDGATPKNNKPALQPAVTYTNAESGLWASAWLSTMLASRDAIAAPTELDLTIGWDKFVNDQFGITLGFTEYVFPGIENGLDSHSEEIFAGIVTENMYINPYSTLYIDFGALEGIYLLVGAGFPLGRKMTLPLTLDVSMGLMSYDTIVDATGEKKSGVSDLNIGVSTSIGTDNFTFNPAIVWTITGMDEVNNDDEIWIKLGVSFGN